jgi:hypothetical protein
VQLIHRNGGSSIMVINCIYKHFFMIKKYNLPVGRFEDFVGEKKILV